MEKMHVNLKETTCSYRKGICTNPRAVKSKGTLHTLCQKHRSRQNEIQRQSDARRRAKITHRRKSRRLGFDFGWLLEPIPFQPLQYDTIMELKQDNEQQHVSPVHHLKEVTEAMLLVGFLKEARFGEQYENEGQYEEFILEKGDIIHNVDIEYGKSSMVLDQLLQESDDDSIEHWMENDKSFLFYDTDSITSFYYV